MARPEDLYPGNCYFLVNFRDHNLLFPSIWTLTYLKCEVNSDGSRSWLFEDPPHFTDSDGAESIEDETGVTTFSDDQLWQILDFPGLIRVLVEVAADHPIHSLPASTSRRAANAQFDEIRAEITKFILNDQYVSLTLTILFTNDGLSIGRRLEGGFEMIFHARPRRDLNEEATIRGLFANIGTAPHVDYFSNRGRTRILHFAVSEDLETISVLCERAFKSIYRIRENDTFKYEFLLRGDIDPTLKGYE